MTHTPRFFSLATSCLVVALVAWLHATATGQDPTAGDKPEPPAPETVKLQTRDGVTITCTWYAGTNQKETVPIIMLHGWGGTRAEYASLARELQARYGHAIIAPDLRGHGESRRLVVGGREVEADLDRMGRQILAGIPNDIEACKQFLMEKNNQGELNIEMLTLVAADAMCIPAINWAIQDWSWPQLIGKKQGQDVKALILLSPVRAFKGVSALTALRHPLLAGGRGPTLSVMIIVGKRNRSDDREASTIYSMMERQRPNVPEDLKPPDLYRQRDLYLIEKDVELRGTKLLDPQFKLGLERTIAGFLHYRLEERKDAFAWRDRS